MKWFKYLLYWVVVVAICVAGIFFFGKAYKPSEAELMIFALIWGSITGQVGSAIFIATVAEY